MKLPSVFSLFLCLNRRFSTSISSLAASKTPRVPMKCSEISLTNYVVQNGVRYVVPYKYEYKSYVKGRWVGRELFEVLSNEFGGQAEDYWENAFDKKLVRINNESVTPQYVVRDKDFLSHITHKHEPAVTGEIVYVGETDELIAVTKPATLPVHPCGSYRFNSLEYIVTKEPLIENQPLLYIVHRLDK